MADEGKKGPTKKKCPTALKRVKQSKKITKEIALSNPV